MLSNWHGLAPESPSILTIADSDTFIAHGASFVRSVYESGMDCHVHLAAPSETCLRGIYKLMDEGSSKLTVSYENNGYFGDNAKTIPMPQLEMRAISSLLAEGNPLLFVRVDSIIRKKIIFPEKSLCLYKHGDSISTDIMFASQEAYQIFNHIFTHFTLHTSEESKQHFLNYLDNGYKSEGEDSYSNLTEDIISYDCSAESSIWRSNGSKEYLEEKAKYGKFLAKRRG